MWLTYAFILKLNEATDMNSNYLGLITVKIKSCGDSHLLGNVTEQYFLDPNKASDMLNFLKDNKDDVVWMRWSDNSGSRRFYPSANSYKGSKLQF
jgi:hypothetical protein